MHGVLALIMVMFLVNQAGAGAWTPNNFIYKPALGARGQTEKNTYDAGLDRVDTHLGKYKTLGDPGHATLSEALTTIGSAAASLAIPPGTVSITSNTTIPANVRVQVLKGGTFDIADGVSLTINGPLEAGLHQIFSCTGTGKVIFGNGVSRFAYPEWWGAKRDGATDDSPAVNAAIASQAGEIRFAAGTYRLNATIKHNTVQIRGVGSATNDEGGTVRDPVTILESHSDTGWIFTIDVPEAPSGIMWGWQLREIRDIYFRGKSGTTRTSNCIRFGSTFVTNADALGRWEIKNCQFRNFDKVIYKPFGQIGNLGRGCYFAHANYHVYIERVGTSNWHGGCDTFEKCGFMWAYKASQYIDSTQSGSGQIVYRDCDFEANPGFGIFVYNYNTDWQPGLILENVWVEDNHTEATVNINGMNYTPKDIYLRNCKNCMMVNTPISNMQLVNSNVFAYNPASQEQHSAGVPVGFESIDKDDDSCFIVQGANITTSTTNPGYYASSINSIKSTKPYGAALNTKPRNKISTNADSLRAAVSFANANTYQWDVAVGGGGPHTGNSVADGRIFDSSCEIEVPVGKTIYPNSGSGAIKTTDKYVVWTVDLKQVSGEQIKFYVNNVTYLGAGAHVTIPSRWTTFAGIAKSDGTSYSAGIDLVAPATGNGTVRISALQIHGFPTYEEAVKFLDSGVYCVGAKRPRIIYSTAAPTTGTWSRGDMCYNTTPSAAGAPGWVCVTAGTPGTWKAMANLAN